MELNLVVGWILVLLGFISGAGLGLRFHDEAWLGGYAAFPRRLLRLGHIALVALGVINIVFAVSVSSEGSASGWRFLASALFVIGGVAMPACCGLTAWTPRARRLFVVPVAALIAAAAITTVGVIAS